MTHDSAPKRVSRPKSARIVRSAAAAAVTDAPRSAPSEDLISARAYQLWLAEGCPDGRALAHWTQAQHELGA